MRLHKYLTEIGYCSRREAEQFIRERKIKVNGRFAKIGDKVDGSEKITIDGKLLESGKVPSKKVIVFNKPKGVETSLIPSVWQKTLMDYNFGDERIFPIGKLDKDAHGILLITNDGVLGNRLAQPGSEYPEEYRVKVAGELTEEQVEKFEQGTVKGDKQLRPHKLQQNGKSELQFVLYDGRCKLIRKIAEKAKIEIVDIERVRIGNLKCENMAVGEWRKLSDEHFQALKEGKILKTGRRRIVQKPKK